ncbi:MAG: TonB-dependent receptor [Bacteroidales bacterium]
MKRVFLFVVVFFAVGMMTVAQNLTGIVTGEDQNPLTGVSVSVKNSFTGTVTNADGEFSLKLKPGEYVLKFSFLGYKPVEKQVKLEESRVKLKIQMEPTVFVTEDVIVQATRASQSTPTSHETMDNEEINRRKMVQDVPYLIQLTPSVVATSESGTGIGYTGFRIRGSDPTRINVTIDGIPYNDAESQGTFWVNMPDFINSVKSVQIQRGVGTSTHGAGAFGATLNFQTKGARPDPYASLDVVAGSYNTRKTSVMAGTGLLNEHFTLDARYSKVLSDGYIDRAFVDHESFHLTAAFRSENDLIKASIIHGNERTGISWWGTPGDALETNRTFNPAGKYIDESGNIDYYDGQTDNYVQNHYHLHYTHLFNQHLNANVSAYYTRGDGYYEQYQDPMTAWDPNDVSLGYYGLPDVEIGDSTISQSDVIRRMMMGNDFYGGLFSLNYDRGRLDASFGGGWNRYDGDHFGRVIWMRYASISEKGHKFYDNSSVKTDGNLYAKVNYDLTEKLSAFGDVQYRHIYYTMEGVDYDLMPDGSKKILDQKHTYDFFNPKAGLYYNVNERMNTYASFAIGHREPTRTHFKDATGDPTKTPEPETLYDYELGYQYNANNLTAGINVYYMVYEDQLVPTGEKSAVGYDIMTNVDDSYRAGIELMAGVKISDRLDWNANLTLSKNVINNFTFWAWYTTVQDGDIVSNYEPRSVDETAIAFSPSIVGASALRFHVFDGFDVSLNSKYVGKQYFDNLQSDQRSIDPYFINDIELSYNINTKLIPEIDLKLQVNNVMNVQYINNAYGGVWYEFGHEKSWAYYFPQAGIHFMGSVNLSF